MRAALAPVRPCANFCYFGAGAANDLLLGNHCIAAVEVGQYHLKEQTRLPACLLCDGFAETGPVDLVML